MHLTVGYSYRVSHRVVSSKQGKLLAKVDMFLVPRIQTATLLMGTQSKEVLEMPLLTYGFLGALLVFPLSNF